MTQVKHLTSIIPLLVLGFSLMSSEPGRSQVSSQIYVGTRPLSMGEAFVAVADDGNAIYWNPAGLARLERIEFNFAHANLFGLGIDNYYASFFSRPYFIPKLTDKLAFGADWSGIRAGEDGLEFRRDQLNLSLGLKPLWLANYLPGLTLGVNAKYLQIDSKLDDMTEADAKGWGADLGFYYDFAALFASLHSRKAVAEQQRSMQEELPKKKKWLRGLDGVALGLMIHNLGDTWVKHATGTHEKVHRQRLRMGMSYRPFESLPGRKWGLSDPVLALDFDDRVHVGAEVWLNYGNAGLAIRGGLQKDLHSEEKGLTISAGLGLQLRASTSTFSGGHVDYAFVDNPGLLTTSENFNIALVFKNNPRLIRIEGAHIEDVFASLYPHYAKTGERAGSVKLRNISSQDTLKAWVAFEKNHYLQAQEADTVKVAPSSTIDLPVRASFSPNILQAPPGHLSGKLMVTYEYHENRYEAEASVDFTLHAKNYLIWDDPAKASAFVAYEDSSVVVFVNKSLQARKVREDERWLLRYNLEEALTLFHALQSYGFTYRKDPVTPFPSLADTLGGSRYQLDMIQYPSEFLRSKERFGDCDDLTVLYASLLQQAGFYTALVSGPGHIFMMFDTGIPASHGRALPYPAKLFYEQNETLWIPVEATKIPRATFSEAWQVAAARLNSAASDTSWKIFEIGASQLRYPPVKLSNPPVIDMNIPDFSQAIHGDMLALAESKKQYIKSFEDSLSQLDAISDAAERRFAETRLRNQYGVALAEDDEFELAKAQFERIIVQDSAYAAAWNNCGNVEFILGNFTRAESLYYDAQDLDQFNRETYMNLAILYQALQEFFPKDSIYYEDKIEAVLSQASLLLEGKTEAADLILGIPKERADLKAAPSLKGAVAWIRKVKTKVDKLFKKNVQRPEIRGKALGRYGAKGYGGEDADRGAILCWSF